MYTKLANKYLISKSAVKRRVYEWNNKEMRESGVQLTGANTNLGGSALIVQNEMGIATVRVLDRETFEDGRKFFGAAAPLSVRAPPDNFHLYKRRHYYYITSCSSERRASKNI